MLSKGEKTLKLQKHKISHLLHYNLMMSVQQMIQLTGLIRKRQMTLRNQEVNYYLEHIQN